MSLLKRAVVLFLAAAIACTACIALAGCGKDLAAKWSGGDITEESVTNTIENLRTYYGVSDDAEWATFVKERKYVDNDSSMTATEKAIANVTPKDDEEKAADGTAEEMRSYIIEQMIRSQIIDNEIKQRDIQIGDDEVNQYVEQQRSYIESRIMPGVFESVLQRQGYANLDAYKQEVREQLKQLKLQQEVSAGGDEEGAVSGKDAWNAWFDDMYANAGVTINPAPNPLPYEIVEVSEGSGE